VAFKISNRVGVLLRNMTHQANMLDNIQYKSNEIETIIMAQTKILEAQFRFRYALGPSYTP